VTEGVKVGKADRVRVVSRVAVKFDLGGECNDNLVGHRTKNVNASTAEGSIDVGSNASSNACKITSNRGATERDKSGFRTHIQVHVGHQTPKRT
jgi:hypothetical protein